MRVPESGPHQAALIADLVVLELHPVEECVGVWTHVQLAERFDLEDRLAAEQNLERIAALPEE